MLMRDPIARAPGGRLRLVYEDCYERPSCSGSSRVRAVLAGRRLRAAAFGFQLDPNRLEGRSRAFRLPVAARRELRAKGRLRLEVTTLLDPGRAAGVLPAEDRLWLRAAAQKAPSDR
jgi:hypothetical protein